MKQSNPTDDTIKIMRLKIIAFLEASGGMAQRSEIRKYVGIDEMTYCEEFNRALKSKKLTPVYGSGEIAPGLFLSRPPVVAYCLA